MRSALASCIALLCLCVLARDAVQPADAASDGAPEFRVIAIGDSFTKGYDMAKKRQHIKPVPYTVAMRACLKRRLHNMLSNMPIELEVENAGTSDVRDPMPWLQPRCRRGCHLEGSHVIEHMPHGGPEPAEAAAACIPPPRDHSPPGAAAY
jgi:hypothetical protein